MLKKWMGLLTVFCLLVVPGLAEEGELSIEEIVEDIDLDAVTYGDVVWDFPVSLEDMDPDLIRLANKHYLLDKSYAAEPLVKVKGIRQASGSAMKLQETCVNALYELFAAAKEDGYTLYLKSAYRSWQTQNTMYSNRLKKNNGKDDGWVAKPGSSDHQTGLGCDIVPKNWRDKSMNEKMAREPECVWMAEHCQEYGFILRYPEDKQDVTEINYEPWHLRYVGVPVATYIMENGLCLEEFTEEMQSAIADFLDAGGDAATVGKFIQTPTE